MEDTIVEFFAILIIIIFHFQEWNKKINKKLLKTVIWATLYKAQWEEHCFFFKETKGSLVWFEPTCGNFSNQITHLILIDINSYANVLIQVLKIMLTMSK